MAKVEERRAAELATKAAFAAKQEDIKRMVNDNAANQEAMQEAEARLQAGPAAFAASMPTIEQLSRHVLTLTGRPLHILSIGM